MFDFVCACCGGPVYDLETMEITDKAAGKRYLICFDCADRYTTAQALEKIKRRYKARKKGRKYEQ